MTASFARQMERQKWLRGARTNDRMAAAEFPYQLACFRFRLAAARLTDRIKAGFRPDQPRVPAGDPDGGQWTRTPGWARDSPAGAAGGSALATPFRDIVVPVGGRGRRVGSGQVRIGGRSLPATPVQQLRIRTTENARQKAITEVRKYDPNWKPRPQIYESVEGLIRANEANRVEAELRILELTGRNPHLGPFFGEWIPSPPLGQRLTMQQARKLDLIGRRYGCHGCGSNTNLTPNGHFVHDHHVPRSLGKPSKIVPHCVFCSARQGGLISALLKRMRDDN